MARAKILYLEDDDVLGELSAGVLAKAGYEVCWKQDGRSGLLAVQQEHFDAVIVDIMMPGMDGYTVVKTLRETHSTLPVIFVSARVLTEDVLKGFEIGGNDYMRKPFSIEELIVRLERLLHGQRPVQPAGDTLSIGRYRFHPGQLRLTLGETTVELSPRTSALLYRLATSPDRTVARKAILLELWGDDTFFNGRSLDVFISKLRKLLAGDPDVRIITIRGTAFRLITAGT